MLKLCEDYSGLLTLPASPYSARVQALFASCPPCGGARFWVQGKSTAVSLVDGVMTVSCGKGCRYDELGEFIKVVSPGIVCAPLNCCERLGLQKVSSSYIVKFAGEAEKAPVVQPDDYGGVYSLLGECGFETGSYGDFLAGIVPRVKAGRAQTAVKVINGELLATASALYIGEKSVLLGAVATSPASRGRGYASGLVSSLAAQYSSAGKEVFLFCRNDSLLGFYKKIGFAPAGKWAEARLG